MSEEFTDDLAGGGGRKPTKIEIILIRDYLKRHNRAFSIRKVHEELLARDFRIGVATVQRALADAPGGNRSTLKEGAEPTQPAQRRVDGRRQNGGKKPPQESPIKPEMVAPPAELKIPTLAELTRADETSTKLAIEENRARMALNIILANQMAARPELLLLDMRGTAALVDALTIAAKLSGGASIDISMSAPGEAVANGSGHDMKDITPPPKSALVMEIDKWRGERAGAQRT